MTVVEQKPLPRIALVTGANRGLGKSTALALASKGVDVIVTYRAGKAEAENVVSLVRSLGRKATSLQLDLANTTTFASFSAALSALLAEDWGRGDFDYLINNAGIGIRSAFEETSEEAFDSLMNVHFKGTFFLTQTLLPLIADGGRIVNVTSGLTRFITPGFSAYASMKGAIDVLTQYLAKELGPRGIAVNSVAPGPVATDFNGGAVRDSVAISDYLVAQTAMGRLGEPDDIGGAIAALVSDDNRWITAQRIEISGGIFL